MRVLFTSSPGWGHVHPMVPLANALIERGDEVLWATGSDATSRLDAEGITTADVGLGERDAMAQFLRRFPEVQELAPSERADFTFPRLFGTVRAEAMLADLRPVAGGWAPDLVVADAAELAGPLVAATLGVPAVCHAFGALLPEPRVAAAGEAVAPLWAAAGLDPRPYGGMYDHLYIDIYPASLQPAGRPHVAITEPLRPGTYATNGDEALPEWVTSTADPPLVYVTFGTVFSNDAALGSIIDGVRDLDVRVVVTVGPHGDPDSLGSQPGNVHVARYIPQAQLLHRCAAVVSHGGSGTFLAALAAEVPQLCVPQAADQFFNAAACARSGAGLALQPDEIVPTAVRHAVASLLTGPDFATAARRVGEEITAMPAPADVAAALHVRFS